MATIRPSSAALGLAGLALGLVVAGCGPLAVAPVPTPTPLPTATPTAVPTATPVPAITPEPRAVSVVDAALRDAATRTAMAVATLRVVQLEARQWSDSALGCPRPGMVYAQVITPGYLVVVSAGSRRLEYHTDARNRIVLCQEG